LPWEGAESRGMPRARRPALHSAETSFRGKGAAACLCRPRPFQVGVFFCVLLPVPCAIASFLPCGGRGGEGEASRGSSRSVASLCPPYPRRNGEQRVLGLLDSVQVHQYTREQSHGCLPSWVYGLRDPSGGEPVRLSVRHTGPPCDGSCSVVLNAWMARLPIAADQLAMV